MNEETDNTLKTSNKPWLWKKGFCPNPGGRPKGKSLKAYAQEYLAKLTDEEKDEWLDGLPKEKVWAMGEGNPKQDTGLTDKDGNDIATPILDVLLNNNSNRQGSETP
jgi:hypothetical protein